MPTIQTAGPDIFIPVKLEKYLKHKKLYAPYVRWVKRCVQTRSNDLPLIDLLITQRFQTLILLQLQDVDHVFDKKVEGKRGYISREYKVFQEAWRANPPYIRHALVHSTASIKGTYVEVKHRVNSTINFIKGAFLQGGHPAGFKSGASMSRQRKRVI